MKILCIFDATCDMNTIKGITVQRDDTIYLFPLTSRMAAPDFFIRHFSSFGTQVEILSTGELVNISAENLRSSYLSFIAKIAETTVMASRTVKDIFKIDNDATLWWFSIVAEKNTYKTDAFNTLAQLDAIIGVIIERRIENVVWCFGKKKLSMALSEYLKRHGIPYRSLRSHGAAGLKHILKNSQRLPLVKHFIFLCFTVIKVFIRTISIKFALCLQQRRLPTTVRDVIVTHYPYFSKELASKGRFRSLYYAPLQQALEEEGKNIVWMAMYVPQKEISFSRALAYTKKFLAQGQLLFFMEEFNSLFLQIKTFLSMIKYSFVFMSAQKAIARLHTFGEYNFYSLFKDDWYSSFAGATGYLGLLYHGCFQKMFAEVRPKRCIYCLEFHAWEKALVYARNKSSVATRLYGYQHSTMSKMLLNYFTDPQEIQGRRGFPLPLPDYIICNGHLPFFYMKESGLPQDRLIIAEAIRYNYLKRSLVSIAHKNNRVVLIAFSINADESSALFNLAYRAFRNMDGIEVWLKPHPFLSLDKVFALSSLSAEQNPFFVKNGNIEEYLRDARVVIAGESGVAIEALAMGCHVITVNVPEWINMSPLRNIQSNLVLTVNSPDECLRRVLDILHSAYEPRIHAVEAQRIISDFFYLNPDSDVPNRFLNALKD